MINSSATFPVLCAFHISPESDKDYTIDVTRQLFDSTGTVADSVASIDWMVDPNQDLQLHSPSVAGGKITVFARNGKIGNAYRVTARVTTNSSPPRKFEVPMLLACIEKAGQNAQVGVSYP